MKKVLNAELAFSASLNFNLHQNTSNTFIKISIFIEEKDIENS